MIQHQIDVFVYTLKNLATEYSNPAIIMDHIPVLRDNPDMGYVAIGGVVAAFLARRVMKKRSAANKKNVALVMPSPYAGNNTSLGDASNASPPAATDAAATEPQPEQALRLSASDRIDTIDTKDPPSPDARSPAQQLEDVAKVSFTPRAALTPDEARLRVIVQAVLKDMGAPHTVMARTALDALLTAAAGSPPRERRNAQSAIAGKYIDFGVFDRTGKLALALNVHSGLPAAGIAALERAIVSQSLSQAGIASVDISTKDTAAEIKTKLAAYISTSSAPESAAVSARAERPVRTERPTRANSLERAERPARPANPARPARPARPSAPSAIAAE